MTTDHLGRELDSGSRPQTVTQFAVEQGTVDGDAEGVQDAVKAEQERARAGTEHAERVSEMMAPDPPQGQLESRRSDWDDERE